MPSINEQEKWAAVIVGRTISICLFIIFAIVPLIITPFIIDYWYQPKIFSIYGLLIVITIFAAVKYYGLKEGLGIKENPLLIPLVVYGSASLLSTIYSISPGLSIFGDMFREEGLLTVLSYMALPVVFSTLVVSEKQIHLLIKGLLVSCALISFYGIMQYSGYNLTRHFIPSFNSPQNRFGSTIGNANFLGKFLVLVLPLFMAYFFTTVRRLEKLLLLTGFIISFSALIVTFTRASWLGFTVSLLIFFFLTGKKVFLVNKKHIALLAFILIAFTIVFQVQSYNRKSRTSGKSIPTVTQKIISSFDLKKGRGVANRLFVWNKAIICIKEKPFLGYGLDTHLLVMRRFNLEYIQKFNDRVEIDRVHNNYLDIAIAQGLIGLAAYLAIIITFLGWLIRTMRAERAASKKIFYCGILAAFCGYLVNDFFIFSVVSVSPTFWSLMGLSIAMKNKPFIENP